MFRFRLARLLTYRRTLEGLSEHKLRQQQHHLQQAETVLAHLHNDCQGIEEQLQASQGTTLSGQELQGWRQYYRVLDQRVSAQKAQVAAAINAVEASRQELITARQQKKVLEQLQKKDYERYRQQQMYREQQTVDALVTARFRHEH